MNTLRKNAEELRSDGYSYSIIGEKLGIPKSTLSNWLSLIPFKPNQEVIAKIGKAKLKSALFKHNQKLTEVREMKELAKKELGEITKRDLWLLGIGLYLGEGSKSHESIRVINSNPQIIKMVIKWFKEIYHLKNKNFCPAIHAYPDNNIKETLNYWSRTTGIPRKQFGKTQVDKRTNKSILKKQKLPYGTLHLYVRSCGNKEFGKKLHRKITGWMEVAFEQINASIV